MQAVTVDALALEFASVELRQDREVVMTAATQSKRKFNFVPNEHDLSSFDLQFVAHLIQCISQEGQTSQTMYCHFPKLTGNLCSLFDEVIRVVNGWKESSSWDDQGKSAAPELFSAQWQHRLLHTQWCLSVVIPGAVDSVLEFCAFPEEHQLIARLRELDPIIRMLMRHPTTSWVEHALDFIEGYGLPYCFLAPSNRLRHHP